MRRWLRSLAKDERGNSIVLLALVMPVILGIGALTVDVTRAFVERRELQNAVDAAALAAAVYLPSTDPVVLGEARNAAIEYASRNGMTITAADVQFSSRATTNDTVTVVADTTVQFTFARVFSVSFGAVGSRGAGQLGTVSGAQGVMPWGVEEPTGGFIFGQTYCLKLGSGGHGGACDNAMQGNFHALDIDDNGNDSADIYRGLIISGSHTTVRVGQIKNVSRGNMQGPTAQGTGCTGNDGRIAGNTETFEDVIQANGDGTYNVLNWSSPRLIIIPVVVFPGPDEAEILGFTVFFLEDCASNGAVLGRFIDTIIPGSVWGPYQEGFGARAVRLVE